MVIRSAQALVEQALGELTTLSVGQALPGRPDVRPVDIRDMRALERERQVPGAFHAPRGLPEFRVDPARECHPPVFAQPGVRYVLYRAAGWRSAAAGAGRAVVTGAAGRA